jgi:hypothetical protein
MLSGSGTIPLVSPQIGKKRRSMAMVSALKVNRTYRLVVFIALLGVLALSSISDLVAQDLQATADADAGQDPITRITTTTQTQITTSTSSNTEEAAEEENGAMAIDNDLSTSELIAIVALGLGMVIIFANFLNLVEKSQERAYKLIENLSLKGIPIQIATVQVGNVTSDPAIAQNAPGGDKSSFPPIVFQANIPQQLQVNKPALITASVEGLTNPKITWTCPDASVQITPAGLGAQIKGTSVGLFVLTPVLVDQVGDDPQPIPIRSFAIEVVEQLKGAQTPVTIPFMGAGTAGFGVVLVLLFLLAFLGVTGVLTGEQTTPIITAVIGAFAGAAGAVVVAEKKDEGK